tara:strand:+ start:1858 stop:2076 length:219 start_codon:yes stop_codon:yes gene_type:complete
MSSEQLNIDQLKTPNSIDLEMNKKKNNAAPRVDINKLLLNVRLKEKKEKQESFVFFSLIGSIVIVAGLIASL